MARVEKDISYKKKNNLEHCLKAQPHSLLFDANSIADVGS